MSFMQREIEFGTWVVYDSRMGGGVIPRDVVGGTDAESLLPFTECLDAADIYEIEVKEGYGARLSAPGYMDCTEWALFDTEADALAYLDEAYPEDEEA